MKRRRPRRRGFGFWAKRLGLFLVAMILLIIGGIAGALWWTLPARHAELALAGLAAPVGISLDTHGIPHIVAQTAVVRAAKQQQWRVRRRCALIASCGYCGWKNAPQRIWRRSIRQPARCWKPMPVV
jgi:hypothetical protein